MKFNILLLLLPSILISQEQITINLKDSSVHVTNIEKHEYIEIDSTYTFHHYGVWGSKESRTDTFFYVNKRVVRKKI